MPKQALFPWVPRAAGTSVWHCLGLTGSTCQRLIHAEQFDPSVRFTTFQHRGLQWLIDSDSVGRDYLDNAFVFGFIRNPWARLVSIWFHLTQHPQKPYREQAASVAGTFHEYVEWATSGDVPPVGNSMLWGADYPNRQLDWLRLDGDVRADFLARVEDADAMWPHLCFLLEIPQRVLLVSNASKHGAYQDHYTRGDRKRVERHYAEVIELYDYTFH